MESGDLEGFVGRSLSLTKPASMKFPSAPLSISAKAGIGEAGDKTIQTFIVNLFDVPSNAELGGAFDGDLASPIAPRIGTGPSLLKGVCQVCPDSY
jgi:hypothetical protein